MSSSNSFKVKVAIPHFFQESSLVEYGSSRSGNKISRQFSFYSCLSSLLSLGDSYDHTYLDLARTSLVSSRCTDYNTAAIDIEIHVFIDKDNCLLPVLNEFSSLLHVHQLSLDNPRLLPGLASQYLFENETPYDLNFYCEDDLVIRDLHFFFKQLWFINQTSHQYVLMPHRYEHCIGRYPSKLFVDGPNLQLSESSSDSEKKANNCERICISGIDPITNTKIDFTFSQNPHSGTFCLSNKQINYVRENNLKPEFYISPLETAATGSISPHFITVKPVWRHSWFLQIQHSNPSFLHLMNKWSYD